MKHVRSGLALSLGLIFITGLANAEFIDDIQVYNPNDGTPQSPYDGQIVTVSGTVYVVKGTYNGGTYYIQGDTGGIQCFAPNANAALGDIVEVTGTVGLFSGEIQITNSPIFVDVGDDPDLLPAEVTVDELLINPDFPELYGDYERVGEYVAVTGTVVDTQFDGGNESFFLGGTTSDLEIFVDETTGIDVSGVQIGDEYKVVGPVTNFNGAIEIKPRYQYDLIEDPTLPVIFDVDLQDWVPRANTPITVQAVITDDVGIASALVYYRDSDGGAKQGFSTVPMTNTSGNDWEGVIPPPHSMSQVDFYVEVTDAEMNVVTNPGNAPAEFFSTAVGITPIYDLQFVPNPDEDDQNPYFGRVVNVRGVITVGTNDFGSTTNSRFIVQEQEPGDDNTYKWGAVLVYESSGANEYFQGDLVEVGGRGSEFNQLTELLPHNPNAINLIDFAQDLPPATLAATAALADTTQGEAYESLWVRSGVAQVLAVDAPIVGSFIIADNDTSNQSNWVTVDPPTGALSYVPTLGDVVDITGFMDAEIFGVVTRDLVPIADEFVLVYDNIVGVEDGPSIQKAGGFRSVHPNPFNPRTQISFAVNKPNLCQLNVYNIRGEKVRTLLQERLSAGEYDVAFDGRNDRGQELASGTYFARLRIGAEVMQVRKLQLVK